MSYLPCRNPSCKSVGSPHPNCRCYADMSEGGDAGFCSSDRKHQQGCEYFAEGGEAASDFIPDDSAPSSAPDFIPDDNEPKSPDMMGGDTPEDLQDKMRESANPKPDFVSDDDFVEDKPKYQTMGQDIAGGAEAVGRGLMGPLATGAELGLSDLGVPGMAAEDIKGREAAHPILNKVIETGALGAGLMTGVGEAALLTKGAALATDAMRLGRVGSAAIKSALSTGAIVGSDEISKSLLGQGDPETPVSSALAHVGAGVLFGALGGAGGAKLASTAASKMAALADSKIGSWFGKFMAGIGSAASGEELAKGTEDAFRRGHQFYANNVAGLGNAVGGAAGFKVGSIAGPGGAVIGERVGEKILGPKVSKYLGRVGKYAVPATLTWLSGGGKGSLSGLMEYIGQVEKGNAAVNNIVSGLFKTVADKSIETPNKDIEKLKEYIGNGGINQNVQEELNDHSGEPIGFAEGGEVIKKAPRTGGLHQPNDPIASTFPEQNILLNTAKGRISNYLSSLHPHENQPKLAFDDAPDNRQQKKAYDSAIRVALKPLSILDHVKDGSIEAEQISHLSNMYPGLLTHLQKKVTEQIIHAQMNGEKPSFRTRQGLSMFMGTALSGELTSENIQAAQAVFAKTEKPQAGGQAKPKGSKAVLSKSDQAYLTDDQARQKRQNKL